MAEGLVPADPTDPFGKRLRDDQLNSGARKDAEVSVLIVLQEAVRNGLEMYRTSTDALLTRQTVHPKYVQGTELNANKFRLYPRLSADGRND